ncbi:MAG: DUF2207 domain-containing protein [Clostridia bacterium]|nr:DUF2207 domain-containing protein [Clostridia bacterium]
MVYYVFAGLIYSCILAILLLALVFGLRAKTYVKREKITCLATGFSPLDVQRVFIGKTYPRRLTRALIVYWAQMGYIRVKHIDKIHVRLTLVKKPPTHSDKSAIFYDRGTYVRERELFNRLFGKENAVKVNINRAMFPRSVVKNVNSAYAVREDEGVYSSTHYALKVLTTALSVAPFFLASIYLCISLSSGVGTVFPFIMCMGLFFFRFVRDVPLFPRCAIGLSFGGGGVGLLIWWYTQISDPLGIGYTAVAILFIGSLLLIRFVDYREKNNLADYSDLVNYRKYLLFARKSELFTLDYYAVLPYLYAFNIKPLVKRKFNTQQLPEWYISESGQRGKLL